jgi:hypothetical protein
LVLGTGPCIPGARDTYVAAYPFAVILLRVSESETGDRQFTEKRASFCVAGCELPL